MATEAQIRQLVREEVERGSNRTIKFMTAVVNESGRTTTDELSKWTKAMADYTVKQITGRAVTGKLGAADVGPAGCHGETTLEPANGHVPEQVPEQVKALG